MINRATIIGNLTKDPELRKTKDNKSTCAFTLGCQRNFKNADDKYDSDFINCVTWSHSADYLCNYAHKGDMIAVSGRVQTRTYKNQEGNNVYVTEIICDDVSIVHSRDKAKTIENANEVIDDPTPEINISAEELPFY